MTLTTIPFNRKNEWNDIVKSFKKYDVYYLNEYVEAFALHGDGEPLLFYFEDGCTRALNVAMKRDIADCELFYGKIGKGEFFDLATPYGYGGFLADGGGAEALNREYSDYCKKKNIVSEFARFHPVLKNAEADVLSGMYDLVNTGATICMDISNCSAMWDVLTSKNRNMVRKAKKNDIKVYWGRNEKLAVTFYDIYKLTMDRDRADKYYYFGQEFFLSILDNLKDNSLFFYAVYKGKIIAMSIVLLGNGYMHYHLSASLKEYMHMAPSNLMIYEAACWGSQNGFKQFHLGGGLGGKKDKLYDFKKAFCKEADLPFFIGKKIFMPDEYDHLIKLSGRLDNDGGYFPEYRAGG